MSRKNNTRSIKRIQDREAERIDLRRKVERHLIQGGECTLTPYEKNMLEPGYATFITRPRAPHTRK